VKHWKFAILTLGLAVVAAPASADVANAPGGYDGVAFVHAVSERDGEKATELLQSRGRGILDAKDDDGNTALIIAASREDEQWTAWLLNKGADPNVAGKGGDTPLIAAARVGFESGAGWLIGKGAKVDGSNRMGETPLIVAVQQRQNALIRLLLEAGADPDKTDTAAGFSARDYAKRDSRSRDALTMIEARKPRTASATAAKP
jgi:ankyrin repeat protein